MWTLFIIFVWLLGSSASYAFASRTIPFLFSVGWDDEDRIFGSLLSLVVSWVFLIILIILVIGKYIGIMIGHCPPFKHRIYNFLKILEPKEKGRGKE